MKVELSGKEVSAALRRAGLEKRRKTSSHARDILAGRKRAWNEVYFIFPEDLQGGDFNDVGVIVEVYELKE